MAQSFGDMLLRKQQGLPCPVCYLSVCASVGKESDECSVVVSALAIKLTQCYNMVTFFSTSTPSLVNMSCASVSIVYFFYKMFVFLYSLCISFDSLQDYVHPLLCVLLLAIQFVLSIE